MNVLQLVELLLKQDKADIEYALFIMMVENKLDFASLNKSYINYLEATKEDNKSKISDANACVISLLNNIKKETKSNHAEIHWALHLLNESQQFNMQRLNEKFNYDKENDCQYSSYWREKNGKW